MNYCKIIKVIVNILFYFNKMDNVKIGLYLCLQFPLYQYNFLTFLRVNKWIIFRFIIYIYIYDIIYIFFLNFLFSLLFIHMLNYNMVLNF